VFTQQRGVLRTAAAQHGKDATVTSGTPAPASAAEATSTAQRAVRTVSSDVDFSFTASEAQQGTEWVVHAKPSRADLSVPMDGNGKGGVEVCHHCLCCYAVTVQHLVTQVQMTLVLSMTMCIICHLSWLAFANCNASTAATLMLPHS
jgi:hypothetical protein